MKEYITIEISINELRAVIRDEVRSAIKTLERASHDVGQAMVQINPVLPEPKTPQVTRQLYSLKDVASATGLSVVYLRQLTASGELKTVRFGRTIRIPADELQSFINRGVIEDSQEGVKC